MVLLRSDGDGDPAYSGFDGRCALRVVYGSNGRGSEGSGELESSSQRSAVSFLPMNGLEPIDCSLKLMAES